MTDPKNEILYCAIANSKVASQISAELNATAREQKVSYQYVMRKIGLGSHELIAFGLIEKDKEKIDVFIKHLRSVKPPLVLLELPIHQENIIKVINYYMVESPDFAKILIDEEFELTLKRMGVCINHLSDKKHWPLVTCQQPFSCHASTIGDIRLDGINSRNVMGQIVKLLRSAGLRAGTDFNYTEEDPGILKSNKKKELVISYAALQKPGVLDTIERLSSETRSTISYKK